MSTNPAKPGSSFSIGAEFRLGVKRRSWAIQLIVSIGCLLARSGSIFEGELSNAGFIQLAQRFRDHAIVLLFVRAREGKIETDTARERKCDPAVFRRMSRREKATVLAVLHVFAIGLKHARGGAGLPKHFAQHF